MANSKYEYVRSFEQPDNLLPNTFIVVRLDGRGFTKLTAKYNFEKPNDRRALDLMNEAAVAVMRDLPDLVLAYGQSDEFSFVFYKDCTLFERRASKLVTTIVSTFTANYVFGWAQHFPDTPLTAPLPSFDGRAVCYPSPTNLRDYLSWRQADCHINNLYNTTFWALVLKGGLDNRVAEKELSGTVSADKNEILFKRFGINYNNEPEIFKKGSVLYRDFFPTSTQSTPVPAKLQTIQPPTPHSVARPMSQPLERTPYNLFRSSPPSGASTATASTPRGPTFLSTSTTPSPPPSPPALSMPTFPKNFEIPSVGHPSTFWSSMIAPTSPPTNGSAHRHAALQPIALPPPTLKPSTRPPPSLDPPNAIAHINTSPLASPYGGRPSAVPSRTRSASKKPVKPFSHSASASLSANPGKQSVPYCPSPKRSPSMSVLESGLRGTHMHGPPQIPLRISSIPPNHAPRKLSLPSQKSYALLRQEASEGGTGRGERGDRARPRTPPLQLMTMKELPSPPAVDYDEGHVRGMVMGSEPQAWSQSPPPPTRGSGTSSNGGHGEMESLIVNPVIPLSPPQTQTQPQGHVHAHTHSHSHVRTVSGAEGGARSYSFPSPPSHSGEEHFSTFDWEPSHPQPHTSSPLESSSILPHSPSPPPALPHKSLSRRTKKARQVMGMDDDTPSFPAHGKDKRDEGRPVQMSKTQQEKERKKRGKAKIVVEHVDLIGDSFWERRPWILSGRAG